MSEVETRPQPTRGRGSGRGGRGGFGRGGQRGTRKPVNGSTQDPSSAAAAALDEPGEIGDMKRKYPSELPMLKDMFPDWTDVDLLFALQECDGDLPATVDRITQGSVSQFSEVKSAKDRARSRVKEESAAVHTTSDKTGTVSRGGRCRGDGTRGRGGRATDRGRGGQRGGRAGHATTNGSSKDASAVSVPTNESSAWTTESATDALTGTAWDSSKQNDAQPVTKTSAPSSDAPAKKTWASMFSAPPKPAPAPKSSVTAHSTAQDANINAQDSLLTSDHTTKTATTPGAIVNDATAPAILAAGIIDNGSTIEEAQIPPPKDPLTAENVEHLPDASHPPATHTAASTVGSNDPRNLTPLPGQPTPSELSGRPALGGFQTSAYRAASGALRSTSYQRRVQEQHEAVVMPGYNAVDRAAVQFGSMGLNGEPGPDVDDEREDPETRHPHQHSPPSQPKASLPPVPRQPTAPAEQGLPEAVSTKQAPGLPPASQQNQPSQQESAFDQSLQPDHSQHGYAQNQYSAYGQSGVQQDNHAAHQKPYDPFAYQTQQQQQQQQYDRYGAQNQNQQQAPQQHSGFGGLTSASHDYSAYYTSAQQRDAFHQYYGSSGSYGADNRQHNQQQDAHGGQRVASGYGNVSADSAYGAQAQQQAQPRYSESANSGHNTPNPLGNQQHSAPNAQQANTGLHQQPQQHQQQAAYGGAASGFPYGHPYFNSPYQQAYQNQFGYTQYGGASYPSKAGGVYGSPHGYNVGSQSSFDQHGSASNTGPYNQNQQQQQQQQQPPPPQPQQPNARNTSGVSGITGSGAEDYGRVSAQGGSQQGGSGYGAINDPFARTPSGFNNQGAFTGQTGSAGQEDGLKAYGDNKTGASPALGQPGRPGSAANNPASTSQSGLPQAQSQQSGYAGYQGYPAQTSQFGGLGGLGGHPQQGQNTQASYGSYNAGAFGQYGGGYNSRGGWGQSYGAH